MYYMMYLSSVCQRRQWPDPRYESSRNSQGYFDCTVRVNNREYRTELPYRSELLAKDNAAMKAFMICRNFSQNDGFFPGQRPGQRTSNGFMQGLPVAIGSGRRSNRSSGDSYYDPAAPDSASCDGTSSGSNSPKSIESGFEQQMQQVTQQLPKTAGRKSHRAAATADGYACMCRRGPVYAYGRCGHCLRENGWA